MNIEKRFAKKDFTYRGKTLEELKALDVREFAQLLPSRPRRAVLKHFDVVERFIKKCEAASGRQIKTHLRDVVIVPKMIGYEIGVHTGREFFNVRIIPEMIGHKLGEFAMTRSKVQHGAPGIGATKSSASASVK